MAKTLNLRLEKQATSKYRGKVVVGINTHRISRFLYDAQRIIQDIDGIIIICVNDRKINKNHAWSSLDTATTIFALEEYKKVLL